MPEESTALVLIFVLKLVPELMYVAKKLRYSNRWKASAESQERNGSIRLRKGTCNYLPLSIMLKPLLRGSTPTCNLVHLNISSAAFQDHPVQN
jgi:hypothetical protein